MIPARVASQLHMWIRVNYATREMESYYELSRETAQAIFNLVAAKSLMPAEVRNEPPDAQVEHRVFNNFMLQSMTNMRLTQW